MAYCLTDQRDRKILGNKLLSRYRRASVQSAPRASERIQECVQRPARLGGCSVGQFPDRCKPNGDDTPVRVRSFAELQVGPTQGMAVEQTEPGEKAQSFRCFIQRRARENPGKRGRGSGRYSYTRRTGTAPVTDLTTGKRPARAVE